MKNTVKFLQKLIIYVLIIQCCAGFTVFKVLRNHHNHKYVHAYNCQLKSSLALDCFNHCNGIQHNSEESQKKDKNSDDHNVYSSVFAILVSSFKISSHLSLIVPHIIYRDVNVLPGATKAIFQPPKAL